METISSNRPKIVVIGSCNTDMVVKANRLPVPGETILGGTFYMNPGGKGANQAIAAARLGAEVTFISKIGPRGQESRKKTEKNDKMFYRGVQNRSARS